MQDSIIPRAASAAPKASASSPTTTSLPFRPIADLVAEVEAGERADEKQSSAVELPLRLFEP